jgi:hypothetical protein
MPAVGLIQLLLYHGYAMDISLYFSNQNSFSCIIEAGNPFGKTGRREAYYGNEL